MKFQVPFQYDFKIFGHEVNFSVRHGFGAHFTGVKWPAREADHSPTRFNSVEIL
jgi:hypothetical protein